MELLIGFDSRHSCNNNVFYPGSVSNSIYQFVFMTEDCLFVRFGLTVVPSDVHREAQCRAIAAEPRGPTLYTIRDKPK